MIVVGDVFDLVILVVVVYMLFGDVFVLLYDIGVCVIVMSGNYDLVVCFGF